MYNGIGLTTPRGSGTSGYVQRSLAYIKPKPKYDVTKQYKDIKEVPTQANRPPNPEILEHEQAHKIEAEIYSLRNSLKTKGMTNEQIEDEIKHQRAKIIEKLKNSELNSKETHAEALAKKKKLEVLRDAFQISADYKIGSAFDIEAQKKKWEEEMALKDKLRKERKNNYNERQRSRSREKEREKEEHK